jgi:hypothetical protein
MQISSAQPLRNVKWKLLSIRPFDPFPSLIITLQPTYTPNFLQETGSIVWQKSDHLTWFVCFFFLPSHLSIYCIPEKLTNSTTIVVLDATSGKPGDDMGIRLDRLTANGFVLIANGTTDADGRCNTLLPANSRPEIGIYKVTFFSNECMLLPFLHFISSNIPRNLQ